ATPRRLRPLPFSSLLTFTAGKPQKAGAAHLLLPLLLRQNQTTVAQPPKNLHNLQRHFLFPLSSLPSSLTFPFTRTNPKTNLNASFPENAKIPPSTPLLPSLLRLLPSKIAHAGSVHAFKKLKTRI
ncbi:hypothetical protein HAX54_047735, partial [Datura stramonium]|nr:hypothetical protein [Datura stramonium]